MTTLGGLASSPGAPGIALEQSVKYHIISSNGAGVPGNHSYYLSYNNV